MLAQLWAAVSKADAKSKDDLGRRRLISRLQLHDTAEVLSWHVWRHVQITVGGAEQHEQLGRHGNAVVTGAAVQLSAHEDVIRSPVGGSFRRGTWLRRMCP